MIVVADTSPLHHLARVDLFDLPHRLYGDVTIPRAVADELSRMADQFNVAVLKSPPSWLHVSGGASPVTLRRVQQERLDEGETEAIALALDQKADLLLIDEARGRAVAPRLGIPHIGLCGMLVAAKRRAVLSVIRPIIERVRADGFYLADALVQRVLRDVGE